MLKLVIARSAAEMEPMRAQWRQFNANPQYSIFQDFDWNRLAAKLFTEREAPYVVMAESDSGLAIISACVQRRRNRLSLLGEELFDYRDVLCAGDESVLGYAWKQTATLAADYNLEFSVHSVRERPGGCWQGLEQIPFTHAPGVSAADSVKFHHPRLALNMRRLLRAGATRGTYNGFDSKILKTIFGLKSQEEGSLFSDPLRVEMLLAVAESAAQRCKIFTLENGSTLVAALVTFYDRQWRRFYTTYYNESWAKHSPGLTLLHAVVEESLAEGLDCDFLTGDQPYKRRLATAMAPLYRIRASAQELWVLHGVTAFAESA